MKLAISAFPLFMLGLNALACPNLAGTWSCADNTGTITVTTVTQQAIPNGMEYDVTQNGQTMKLLVDAAAHPVSQGNAAGNITSSCADDQTIKFIETLTANDQSYFVNVTGTVSLTDPQTYVDAAQVIVNVKGQNPQVTNSNTSCTLQQ